MTFGRTMQTTMMRKGRRQIWSVFHPSSDNFKKNSFQNQTVKIGGGIDLAKYGKKRKDTEEDEQVILDYDDFYKGKPSNSKTDEFSEKFQQNFFSEIHDRSIVYNGKSLQYKFRDYK